MQFHFLSLGSAILGVIALFLSALVGIATSFTGILLAFFASRRKEKGCAVGMFIGATVMIFLNLQTFGLFASPAKSEIEKVYSSIRLTNKAYSMLTGEKSKTGSPGITTVIDDAMAGAKQVDVELIESMVSGFAESFQGNYIKGFTILGEGYKETNKTKQIAGAMLIDNWAKWNQANKDLIEKERKKTPSLAGYLFNS